jgi:hypothetical protein
LRFWFVLTPWRVASEKQSSWLLESPILVGFARNIYKMMISSNCTVSALPFARPLSPLSVGATK